VAWGPPDWAGMSRVSGRADSSLLGLFFGAVCSILLTPVCRIQGSRMICDVRVLLASFRGITASEWLRWRAMRSDNLQLLNVALQKLEQSTDKTRDPRSTAELKSILVGRIAKLELVRAIEDEVTDAPAGADDELIRLSLSDDHDLQ
jgi:hypothetical protein